MACCFGGGGSEDDPQFVENPRYDELTSRLSSIIPPVDVDWAGDATVNLAGVAGPGTSSTTSHAAFERRQSMRAPSGGLSLQWTDSRKLLEAAIAMEQLEPMGSIPEGQAVSNGGSWGWDMSALQVEEQRLQERLFKLKLEHCVMDGDGNCQFRATSFGLFGTPSHHGYVRRRVVEYMRQHPGDFAAFLGEDWGGYLANMSRDGTWGDELTLRATCEAMAVLVNVITSDQAHWFVRYIPRSTRPQRECFVTYIAPLHYNAVRRQHTGDRLRHSFGRQGSQLTRAVSTYQKQYGIPEQPQHVVAAGLM